MKEVLIDGILYVPAEPQMDPLAEVKAAHKAGKTVQARSLRLAADEWTDWDVSVMGAPNFDSLGTLEYRIKPEPKPDVVVYGRAFRAPELLTGERTEFAAFGSQRNPDDNLFLVFDGETKKLKSAKKISSAEDFQ